MELARGRRRLGARGRWCSEACARRRGGREGWGRGGGRRTTRVGHGGACLLRRAACRRRGGLRERAGVGAGEGPRGAGPAAQAHRLRVSSAKSPTSQKSNSSPPLAPPRMSVVATPRDLAGQHDTCIRLLARSAASRSNSPAAPPFRAGARGDRHGQQTVLVATKARGAPASRVYRAQEQVIPSRQVEPRARARVGHV